MEPIEWMVLGIGAAIVGLVGSKRPDVLRNVTRRVYHVEQQTRSWANNVRHDFQAAVGQARAEREEADFESDREQAPQRVQKST